MSPTVKTGNIKHTPSKPSQDCENRKDDGDRKVSSSGAIGCEVRREIRLQTWTVHRSQRYGRGRSPNFHMFHTNQKGSRRFMRQKRGELLHGDYKKLKGQLKNITSELLVLLDAQGNELDL